MKDDLRRFTIFLDKNDWLAEFKGQPWGPVMLGCIRLKLQALFDRYLDENPNVVFPKGAKIGCSFERTYGNVGVSVFMTVPAGLFNQKVLP